MLIQYFFLLTLKIFYTIFRGEKALDRRSYLTNLTHSESVGVPAEMITQEWVAKLYEY
jgi:hypothetical protein